MCCSAIQTRNCNEILNSRLHYDAVKLLELADVWQFITLAGFHSNGLQIDMFSRAYAERKMLAYVEMVRSRIHRRTMQHALTFPIA